jgi:hypothetical protein
MIQAEVFCVGVDENDGKDVENEADWVEVQKTRRKKRQVGTVLHGLLVQTVKTSRLQRPLCLQTQCLELAIAAGSSFASEGKKLPAMIDALSGQPLKQDITIDMSDAVRSI